ncbi:MAG TPA: hypothetical protein VFW62_04485, partial [bacterium]|nr:hypothetical protein [bacterium]
MPATESTWRNQALLHRIFAVTGVLLTLATVWMFYKDHYRSWKKIQPKSLQIEQKMTRWREEQVVATDAYRAHERYEENLRKAETAGIDMRLIAKDVLDQDKLPETLRPSFIASLEADAERRKTSVSTDSLERDVEKLNDLHAEAEEAHKAAADAAQAAEKKPADEDLESTAKAALASSLTKDEAVRAQRRKVVAQMRSWANTAKKREDKLLNERKVRNGKIDAAKANVDIAIRDQKSPTEMQKEVDRLINEPESGFVALNANYQATSDHRKHLERIIKSITDEEDAAKKAAADATADLARLKTSFQEKKETWFVLGYPLLGKKFLNLPILDAFGTTRKIDNLWSKDLEIGYGSFSNVRRF